MAFLHQFPSKIIRCFVAKNCTEFLQFLILVTFAK